MHALCGWSWCCNPEAHRAQEASLCFPCHPGSFRTVEMCQNPQFLQMSAFAGLWRTAHSSPCSMWASMRNQRPLHVFTGVTVWTHAVVVSRTMLEISPPLSKLTGSFLPQEALQETYVVFQIPVLVNDFLLKLKEKTHLTNHFKTSFSLQWLFIF